MYYDKAIPGSAVLFGMTKDLSLGVVDPSHNRYRAPEPGHLHVLLRHACWPLSNDLHAAAFQLRKNPRRRSYSPGLGVD